LVICECYRVGKETASSSGIPNRDDLRLNVEELLYGTQEKRENDRASVILHTIRCKGRGYKDVY
jgi:hypothetical protein